MTVKLDKLLANLGYGSRQEMRALIKEGRVTEENGEIRIDGEPLDPPQGVVLMLHKPEGFTCSTADPGRIVYELLPERFMRRNPVIAPVGRLDRDSTGLLLLTDDGALSHRITAPKRHVAKTYEVTLARPLSGEEAAVFASGTLMLRSETTPLAPAQMIATGPHTARITITEGRYHQVKRMFAALGNHVEKLHRAAIGGLSLGDLPAGQWRILSPAEIALVLGSSGHP